MDDAIDLATLAGGFRGDDQQRVAAGIAIAAVSEWLASETPRRYYQLQGAEAVFPAFLRKCAA